MSTLVYLLHAALKIREGCLDDREHFRHPVTVEGSGYNKRIIGASVSEPHTSGFNAAFSLLYGLWTSYVISKFAINISMFHL